MKVAVSNYPFAVYAETKTSNKTGKDYLSVSVKKTSKDANGNAQNTFFNLFDEKDLLALSALCQQAYWVITTTKTQERFGNIEKPKAEPNKETEDTEFKDDDLDSVPF